MNQLLVSVPACVAACLVGYVGVFACARSWGRRERRRSISAMRVQLWFWLIVVFVSASVAAGWYTRVHLALFGGCVYVGFPGTVGLFVWALLTPVGRRRRRCQFVLCVAALGFGLLFASYRSEWSDALEPIHRFLELREFRVRTAMFLLLLGGWLAVGRVSAEAWGRRERACFWMLAIAWGVSVLIVAPGRRFELLGYLGARPSATRWLLPLVWCGCAAIALFVSVRCSRRGSPSPEFLRVAMWGFWLSQVGCCGITEPARL